MLGSDRPNVLKVAQSVPGAWPTIPTLTRLMSSQATFEPRLCQNATGLWSHHLSIPDIENSCSRDSSRKTPPSVGSARFSSPKTRPLPANPTGMSAVLPHLEITPQRPDWLADDTVLIGPVSHFKFPASREFAGNF